MSYLINQAHQNGIQVDLSLGGLKTCGTDAKLPKDPTSSAKDLADFMKTMDIDSADFDIENSSIFTQNNPNDVSTFFSSLHQNLSELGKQSTLTVEGGSLNDPSYAPLIDNFNEKFDSVNLMLYSNTQYTLNPRKNNIWPGIEGWIDKVGDPSKVHLGFYDKIDYRNQASNQDGGDFHPNASTSGAAAGQIYQQILQMLQQDGKLKPGQSLGDPFFWTDKPGSPSSIEFMEDFNNQLKGIKKNPWS